MNQLTTLKRIALLVIFLNSTLMAANDLLKIKLDKNQKIKSTLSAEIGDGSLHMLNVRDKSTSSIELHIYYIDAKDKVLEMEKLYYDDTPNILSYHINDNQLHFFTYLEKTINHIVYNLEDGKFKNKELVSVEKPNYIFRNQDKSLFVRTDKEAKALIINEYTNSYEPKTQQIQIADDEKINWFFNSSLTAVKVDEYVEKGAIGPNKLYYIDGSLIATHLKNDILNYFVCNLNNGNIIYNSFNHSPYNSNKKNNSFVYGNWIAKMNTQKDEFSISIVDIATGKLMGAVNSETDFSYIFKSDSQKEQYLKKIRKKTYHPTITVNKSIDGNAVVRLSIVNVANYSYHYDWWFHNFMFQQQMQMQIMNQQINQTIQNLPRFEPNPDYYESAGLVYNDLDENLSFEFVLNSNIEILKNGNTNTIFKHIKKEKYSKPYRENPVAKNFSACFVNNKMRYLYFDKKLKTIFINSHSIKE